MQKRRLAVIVSLILASLPYSQAGATCLTTGTCLNRSVIVIPTCYCDGLTVAPTVIALPVVRP